MHGYIQLGRRGLGRFMLLLVLSGLALSSFDAVAETDKYFAWDAARTAWNAANWSLASGGPYTTTWGGWDRAVFETTGGSVSLGANQSANAVTFNADGYSLAGYDLKLGNPGAYWLGYFVTNGATATVNSSLSNSGSGNPIHIGKAGYDGTLVLNGNFANLTANNRALSVEAGTLRLVTTNTALSGGSGGMAINAGAALVYDNADTVNWGVNTVTLTGAGTFVKRGAGNLILGSGGWVYINLGVGALIDLQEGSIESSSHNQGIWTDNYADLNIAAGATLSLKEKQVYVGALTGEGTVAQNYTGPGLTVGRGDRSGTFDGVIVNGTQTAALEKIGSGTQVLTGANLYTGTTRVNGGTLVLRNNQSSPSYVIAADAVLEMNVDSGTRDMSAAAFSGAGTLRKTGSGTLRWPGTIATFHLDSGAGIDVQGGELVGGSFGNDVWTDNLSDLNVAAGAVFNGVEANVRVDALTGEGTIRSGYNGAGYDQFTFGVDNGSGIFDGVLANSTSVGNYVKTGSGTQTLTGDNTFTGTLTVQDGRLNIDGDHSAATGALIVSFGAELGGAGTLGGAVTVNGTHAPGSSPGTQTFAGGLIYGDGAILEWELADNADTGNGGVAGTDFDQVLVSGGNLSISGSATLALKMNGAGSSTDWSDIFWGTNHSWVSIDFQSAGTSSGVFGSVMMTPDSLGQILATSRPGAYFTVDRVSDDIVVSYVIPEPATLGLLGAAAFAILLGRRNPRRPPV